MLSIDTLLLLLAFIFFILAGFNVSAGGKVSFQWLAFACLVATALIGGGSLG